MSCSDSPNDPIVPCGIRTDSKETKSKNSTFAKYILHLFHGLWYSSRSLIFDYLTTASRGALWGKIFVFMKSFASQCFVCCAYGNTGDQFQYHGRIRESKRKGCNSVICCSTKYYTQSVSHSNYLIALSYYRNYLLMDIDIMRILLCNK